MAIAVALYPNHLTNDGTEFARVMPSESVSFDHLLEDMSMDTAMEKTDMASVFSRFKDQLMRHLQRGHRIETPIGIFSPGISSGALVTNGHNATVDKSDLKVNFTVSQSMVNMLRLQGEVEQIDYTMVRSPHIKHIINAADESENDFPVNCLCHLTGKRLSFDKDEVTQGIFFIEEANLENAVRMNVYSRTGSSYVDFLLDGLSAGTYIVEIRTENRITRYEKTVTVV